MMKMVIIIVLLILLLNAVYKFLYDYDCSLEELFDLRDMLNDWFNINI